MNEFTWKGFNWRIGHPWGITHPDKKNSWFGEDTVTINNDDVLELTIAHNPRDFDGVMKAYSVGLISCCNKLSHGTYKWKVKLPVGTNLWPACWVCGWDTWPPEIDMMEGYTYTSSGTKDYVKNIFSTKIETNVHYGTAENHQHIKGAGVPTLIYKLFKKKDGIDEYSFKWTKKYIKFYFNGILIRTVKNAEIIKQFNQNKYVYPIMNLEINENFEDSDCKQNPIFKIYDFQYFPE